MILLNQIPSIPLPPKFVSETKPVNVNFINMLSPGDALSSVTSITSSVIRGSDPSPQNILSGSSTISGTSILQTITGGIGGTLYQLTIQCLTIQNQVLTGTVSFWIVPG